jgi:excisionase family DNA binding protein
MLTMSAMPELLTASEVADLLRVSPSTVRRLARRGDLPVIRVGSQLRFHTAEIDRRVSARERTPA